MPARKRTHRIPSPDIQGDDSWVELNLVSVAEAEELQAAYRKLQEIEDESDDDDDDDEASDIDRVKEIINDAHSLLSKYVLNWNWVDDDGEPLDAPHNNAQVIKKLLPNELQFIMRNLTTGGDALEKKGKKSKRR